MRVGRCSLVLTVVSVLTFSMSAWGTIINGDFGTGDFAGWMQEGPGTLDASSEMAVMITGYDPDTGAYITTLSQSFVIPEYPLPLTFDFLFETTGPVSGLFIDALTVSLETDMGNLIDFLIADGSGIQHDPICSLTDPNADGFYTLSMDVSRFSGANATIFFDLWDEDAQDNSTAKIDNVSCEPFSEPIPEPGTIFLMLVGLVAMRILRKTASIRRRSR